VLLANSKHDFSEIYTEIGKLAKAVSSNDERGPELAVTMQNAPIFSAENIFWSPDQNTVDARWASLWTKSLDLGLQLLSGTMNKPSQWSPAEFWKRYEELRADIKDALFSPVRTGIREFPADENRAIHEILTKIIQEWRRNAQAIPSGQEEESDEAPLKALDVDQVEGEFPEDIVIKETVVLSIDNFREQPLSHGVEEGHIPETVVAKLAHARSVEISAPAAQSVEDIPETVIVARDSSQGTVPPHEESQESEVPETVIVSPRKPSGSHTGSEEEQALGAVNSRPSEQNIGETHEETPVEKTQGSGKEKDDDIPETVIVDPTKKRGER
jgi:hypothetical protein